MTVDLRPAAIVFPRDEADVAAVVAYAAEHGLRIAPQSTGHNAGPLVAMEDTILVNVRELRAISIDPLAERVRVGAGVRWGDVVPRLSELGLAALHGSSPLVGIAGYSLGGGWAGWRGATGCRPTASRRSSWSPPTGGWCAPTRPTTRTCSGPCAVVAATTAW